MTGRITTLLDELGIAYYIETHPPVFTVQEAVVFHGETIVKNLLLKEEKGGQFVFVIMQGTTRLNIKKLAESIGLKKLQFAKADELKDTLGVDPGSASLFSLVDRDCDHIRLVVDADILHDKKIGFHPNINTSSIFITGSDITLFLRALNVPYTVIKLASFM